MIRSCVSPNDQRLKIPARWWRKYQVDGVVEICRRATAVESLAIKRHVRQQHNILYIAIETDYSNSMSQKPAPCRAFIEMLYEWQWHIRLAIRLNRHQRDLTGRRRDYAPLPRSNPFRPATAITEAWETLREAGARRQRRFLTPPATGVTGGRPINR